MQLQTLVTPAKPAKAEQTAYTGHSGNIDAVAGQVLKLETSPDGVEILNVEVPAGKRWVVAIGVNIQEFDA